MSSAELKPGDWVTIDGLKTETALEMYELIQRTRDRGYILPRTDIPI